MQSKSTRKKTTAKTTQSTSTQAPATQAPSEPKEPKQETSVGQLMPKLSRGDRGPEVVRLQALLNLYGRSSLKRDGMFMAQTEEAVREHQSDHQLPTSGKVDAKTWQHLLTSKL